MASEPQVYRPADACKAAEVAPYVLRYWESEFPILSEGKEKGVSRLYSARDVRIIARIRELLYDEGFTVAGAKKRLETEIAEGRFDEGLATAPGVAEQKKAKKASAGSSPASLFPGRAPESSHSQKPTGAATAPAKAEGFAERRQVLRELKEIVQILDRSRRR